MTRIDGHTRLLAHIGDPTGSFRAPLIYNPYFAHLGLNAAVVPMGVRADDFASAFPAIMRFTNVDGALITMPHKVRVVEMLAEASAAVRVAGACNAVRRRADGGLSGEMFDGEGFVRGVRRKGRGISGASALVVGAGGVGSAIAASLAGAGIARLTLYDVDRRAAEALAGRLARHFPRIVVTVAEPVPDAHDILVNATPLGMKAGDPLPFAIDRARADSLIGEVVLAPERTPLLAAALARGLAIQPGIDMLFEQIPAYLEFFGLPTTTPEELRRLADIGK